MATQIWISQSETVKRLGVSRQQVHRLRKVGVLRFRMVKGKRGMVPEYRSSDVKRRQEAGARPGSRLGDAKNRGWEQRAVYEMVNCYLRHPAAAHAVIDFAIEALVSVDELCSVAYEKLASSPRTRGTAERFRALCLAATSVPFDWRQLAEITSQSPSECALWDRFVRQVLPFEFRGKSASFEYNANKW